MGPATKSSCKQSVSLTRKQGDTGPLRAAAAAAYHARLCKQIVDCFFMARGEWKAKLPLAEGNSLVASHSPLPLAPGAESIHLMTAMALNIKSDPQVLLWPWHLPYRNSSEYRRTLQASFETLAVSVPIIHLWDSNPFLAAILGKSSGTDWFRSGL